MTVKTNEEKIARLKKTAEEQAANGQNEEAFLNYVAIMMRGDKSVDILNEAQRLLPYINKTGSRGKYHNIFQVMCDYRVDLINK